MCLFEMTPESFCKLSGFIFNLVTMFISLFGYKEYLAGVEVNPVAAATSVWSFKQFLQLLVTPNVNPHFQILSVFGFFH